MKNGRTKRQLWTDRYQMKIYLRMKRQQSMDRHSRIIYLVIGFVHIPILSMIMENNTLELWPLLSPTSSISSRLEFYSVEWNRMWKVFYSKLSSTTLKYFLKKAPMIFGISTCLVTDHGKAIFNCDPSHSFTYNPGNINIIKDIDYILDLAPYHN